MSAVPLAQARGESKTEDCELLQGAQLDSYRRLGCAERRPQKGRDSSCPSCCCQPAAQARTRANTHTHSHPPVRVIMSAGKSDEPSWDVEGTAPCSALH